MKDKPLSIDVVDSQLIIGIGIDTLAFAGEQRTRIKVTNPEGFARDVVIALCDENEIGASDLTDTLDSAMTRAVEGGSEHVEFD